MISKKILMIGNSFSISVGWNLPDIVREAGHSLKLVSAYIGGCPLSRHVENLERAGQDPDFRPYDYRIWTIRNGRTVMSEPEKAGLDAFLKDDLYDIVTIQQASHFSWDWNTYQPFAGQLIDGIRAAQPQAEIVVQQTWAYRIQDPRLEGEWGFGQEGMFRRLDEAYRKLADAYGFRRIPTGTAVQISRERTPEQERFRRISPEEKASFRWPDLPPQAGDVVGAMSWHRTAEGRLAIGEDNIHLNKRGEYLQACVWFGALFGEDPRLIRWTPGFLSDADAAFLRECAYEALIREGLFHPETGGNHSCNS